jgi:type IV pilus assembly protein PilO
MDVRDALQRLNNLDVEDLKKIGTAPKPVQYIAIAVICIAVVAAMGWFLVKPEIDELERVQQREGQLLTQFEGMQARAANLQDYKDQLEEMEESFGAMLRQLPDETDMESLIIDLSQTSIAAGLEVEFFRPRDEIRRDFYAEYPIELRVSGRYHEFGNFVSGLAALPRIVTLHDINIEPTDGTATGADSPELTMTLTARTYRYLDEEEAGGGEN